MRTSTTQPPLGTPLNRSHPLSKGLVGCWLLNEGGGQKAIDSTRINSIDGTLTNGAIYKQTARGNAVIFDGSDDFITSPNNSFIQTVTDLTLSCWVYVISFVHSLNQIIQKNSTNAQIYGLLVQSTQTIFQLSTGNLTSTAAVLTLGKWYHVCGVRSTGLASANAKLYINGVKDATTANGTATINTLATALTFGTDAVNAGRQANILLQNVMQYNRPLSDTEVMQLYTNPYQMFVGKTK